MVFEIKGEVRFVNNKVFIWTGHHEVELFTYLASLGLKNKVAKITVEKTDSDEKNR